MQTFNINHTTDDQEQLLDNNSMQLKNAIWFDSTCVWVNGIAAILISPLFMILDSLYIGILLASVYVALLALKFHYIKVSGLIALACCWIWTLQALIPETIMIDARTQLNLVSLMLVAILVIKATQNLKHIMRNSAYMSRYKNTAY